MSGRDPGERGRSATPLELLYDLTYAMFRIATIVQMIGVIVLTFGLPVSFSAAAHGQSPNNLDLGQPADVTALVSVIALVALGAIFEVVGHELVGFRHTLRVVEREGAGADG